MLGSLETSSGERLGLMAAEAEAAIRLKVARGREDGVPKWSSLGTRQLKVTR